MWPVASRRSPPPTWVQTFIVTAIRECPDEDVITVVPVLADRLPQAGRIERDGAGRGPPREAQTSQPNSCMNVTREGGKIDGSYLYTPACASGGGRRSS